MEFPALNTMHYEELLNEGQRRHQKATSGVREGKGADEKVAVHRCSVPARVASTVQIRRSRNDVWRHKHGLNDPFWIFSSTTFS